MFIILSIICWIILFFISKNNKIIIPKGFHLAGGGGKKGGEGVTVDYHWIFCYLPDTQVLTEDGFMTLKDIVEKKQKIKIATLNPKTNKVEYHYPINYFKFPYSGKMINFEHMKLSLPVTPNHNMFVAEKEKTKKYIFKKAEDIKGKFKFSKEFNWEGIDQKFFIFPKIEHQSGFRLDKYSEIKIRMEKFLAFLGFYISEGSCFNKGSNHYVIQIGQKIHKNLVRKIFSNLKKPPIECKRKDGLINFRIFDYQLYQYFKQFGHAKDKFIPIEIKKLNKKYLIILLKYLILGDGNKTKSKSYTYITISEKLANDVFEIATKCGFACSINQSKNGFGSLIYRVNINKYTKKYKEIYCNDEMINNIDYEGDVYCLEVPNNLMFVKTKFKGAIWCGNSAAEIKCYEKPLITFEARLGNVLYIGGVTPATTYIPSYWLKKYFYARGYGYIKTWPFTIRLFKNSLSNELTEGVDFTYDNTTGEVILSVGLVTGDLVAGDWCYDEANKEETSYFADFSFAEIYKRLKTFKYYKYQDDGLNTYLKCNQRAKHFLSEIHKPMVYGNYDIVFNPDVKIGNSIYINHTIPNVQRIFFIDKIRESHSKNSHAVEISGISFPETYETINRYQQQVSGNRLQFILPELIITFIGSSQHTDGLYFAGRANKIGSTTIDVIYRSPLELKMSKSDEFKIFPGIGFTPNTKDLGVLHGRIYQWYDISFSNLASTYGEFDDADVFFAQRLVNFSLYNTTDSYEVKDEATTMYIGREEILNKGHNLAYYASGDHILFFDTNGDFWLSDYRFATKKMIAHSISATSIEMIGSYNYCFVLFDNTLEQFDIDNETWSIITTLSNNYPLKQPDRKFYIDIEDNTYLYSHGNITGSVGNYNNTLDVLRYKQGVVTEVNYCNQTGVADYKGGVPYIFDKWVFWGQSAWELYSGAYTHGHLPISPTGILSVYYTANYDKTVQWCAACTDRTNSLTATYGKGKKWNFFRRTTNELAFGWDDEGEITFTNDMIIIPLGRTYYGLIVYLKGLDLQSIIHPNTDCAIGIMAHNDKKIELKLAKVEGESDPIYNHSFFLNGKLYVGWKDLSNIQLYETIGEIDLT